MKRFRTSRKESKDAAISIGVLGFAFIFGLLYLLNRAIK